MAFFSDIFNRAGRVARGQANQGMGVIEDATFERRSAMNCGRYEDRAQ